MRVSCKKVLFYAILYEIDQDRLRFRKLAGWFPIRVHFLSNLRIYEFTRNYKTTRDFPRFVRVATPPELHSKGRFSSAARWARICDCFPSRIRIRGARKCAFECTATWTYEIESVANYSHGTGVRCTTSYSYRRLSVKLYWVGLPLIHGANRLPHDEERRTA